MHRLHTELAPSRTTFRPSSECWPDAGVYQLWIEVSQQMGVQIGHLGRFVFPVGRYIYTDRASRGLRARVSRHAVGGQRKHWHIDYLLAEEYARIVSVVLASPDPNDECAANQRAGDGGRCIALGFGSSDCRAGCTTHLWRITEPWPTEPLRRPIEGRISEHR